MRFYDTDPFNENSMMGWAQGTTPDQPYDMAVVMPAPTPRRNTTRGNLPIGKMSDIFLREHHARYFGYEQSQALNVYWTYLVKTPVKFKKKPPIKAIREGLPKLIQELRLVLKNTTQSPVFGTKSLVECPYCHSASELGSSNCNQCGGPLGGIQPYFAIKDKPKMRVLVQGTEAAKALCPGFKAMSDDHGALFFNPDLDAYMIPTFDFWSMRYDPVKEELITRDLERFWTLPDPEEPAFEIVSDFIPTSYLDPIVVDIETSGLNPFTDKVTMIGFKNLYHNEPVKIVENPTAWQISNFMHNLELNRTLVIAHNGQFDVNFTTQVSKSEVPDLIHDTMLMAFVQGEQPLNLKHLTTMHTDRPGPRAFGGIEDYGYLAEDVLSTEALYHKFSDDFPYALNLLHDILPRMIRMRQFGVYIDQKIYRRLIPEFQTNVEQAKAKLDVTAKAKGFIVDDTSPDAINYNSSQQVVDLLLKAGVPLRERTPSGNFSASEPVLQSFTGYPVIDDLLDYRFHVKQLSFLESYEEYLQYDGFLHPRMMLHGTETGRLSCRDPNLQQVPRVGPIKQMFVSRWDLGKIGLIDLSQAELRVTAILANDQLFAEALLAEDVHRKIASMIFGKPEDQITSLERKASKAITFGLLYGGSDQGLASRAGLAIQQVTFVRKTFLSTFTGVNNYLETTKQNAIESGWVVSPLGRRRNIRHVLLREGEHGAGRKATNAPIQGTASDIMLFINNDATAQYEHLQAYSRPIFGVHDSTILDIHPDEISLSGHVVQQAFMNLSNTPLVDFPLYETLPIIGELILAKDWAGTESTNEAYKPEETLVVNCSSHATEYAEFYTPEPKTIDA